MSAPGPGGLDHLGEPGDLDRLDEAGGLAREMQAIGAAIRHARAAVTTGGTVEVAPLESRVDGLCARLTGLRAGEGAAFRAGVLGLIDDLGQLAGAIDGRLKRLREDLKRGGAHARAPGAAAQGARPDRPKR